MKDFILLSNNGVRRPVVPFDIQSVRIVRAHWTDQGFALEVQREVPWRHARHPARSAR